MRTPRQLDRPRGGNGKFRRRQLPDEQRHYAHAAPVFEPEIADGELDEVYARAGAEAGLHTHHLDGGFDR